MTPITNDNLDEYKKVNASEFIEISKWAFM